MKVELDRLFALSSPFISLLIVESLFEIMSVVVPMFFRFPEGVMMNLLSQWLDIRDVGRLDTAMTMHSLRPTFLKHLQRMRRSKNEGNYLIEGEGTGLTSFKFLVWLSNRRIYVENISVWSLGSASITEDVKKGLPFLRGLSVSGPNSESDIITLVKTSPALKSISLYYIKVQEVLRQIADQCPLLEDLTLWCSFSMDDFLYLLNKCSELRNITLKYDPFKEWAGDNWKRLHPYGHLIQNIQIHANGPHHPAFADFIGACPCLKTLHYCDIPETSKGEILLRAAQTCPLLEFLSFDTHSSVALVALVQNCKKLRHVSVTGESLSTSDLANLNQLENLECLSLDQSDLTSGHMALICEHQNIKVLEIQQCLFEDMVTDGMFDNKPISRSLETIRIISRGAPATALSCLTACSNLREIDMYDCRCDDASLLILATHFPLLETITIGYSKESIVGLTFFFTQHKDLVEVTFVRHNLHDGEVNAGFKNFLRSLRNYFPHIHFGYEDKKY